MSQASIASTSTTGTTDNSSESGEDGADALVASETLSQASTPGPRLCVASIVSKESPLQVERPYQ